MCPRKKVSVAAVNDKNFDVILTTEDNLSVFMCLKKLKISIERIKNGTINVSNVLGPFRFSHFCTNTQKSPQLVRPLKFLIGHF